MRVRNITFEILIFILTEYNYNILEISTGAFYKDYAFRGLPPCPDPFLEQPNTERNIKRNDPEEQHLSRLLLALMKWTARFTKCWYFKNGSEYGGNPRNA